MILIYCLVRKKIQRQRDRYKVMIISSICKMNWTDTLRKLAEINFRKDDPLLWWRSHETYFPTIAKLARKYLCIPASTAPSERVFSTAKNILQKKSLEEVRILEVVEIRSGNHSRSQSGNRNQLKTTVISTTADALQD
ncbi:hypothetical protein EMCRGX_G034497 [Ephydatia muelleri]